MLGRLFLLFTLGPLVELALLIYVSDLFGWKTTLAVVISTGLLGAWLVRREGWRAWNRFHGDLNAGRIPADSLVDGLMVFAGGVLLITPGVLSDLLGISLVFPPTRALLRRYARSRIQFRATGFGSSASTSQAASDRHDEIIDVRVIDRAKPEA